MHLQRSEVPVRHGSSLYRGIMAEELDGVLMGLRNSINRVNNIKTISLTKWHAQDVLRGYGQLDLTKSRDRIIKIIDEVLGDRIVLEGLTILRRIGDGYFTFLHSIRVAVLSLAIGAGMGFDEEELKELAIGTLLHDIGKSKTPENILIAPRKLEYHEEKLMREHTTDGEYILKYILGFGEKIALVALNHHRRLDGSGYPANIKGELDLYSRICGVADVYDAAISDRPYKKGEAPRVVMRQLIEDKNKFDNGILVELQSLSMADR